MNINAVQLQSKASNTLSALLQDYSNFHIYTIDGFFQYVLKGFFKEIGIHSQYNIEMNQDQILDKATDLVFYELAESNDHELVKWLTRYSETEIEDGNTWNLKNKIKQKHIKFGHNMVVLSFQLLSSCTELSSACANNTPQAYLAA